MPMVRRIFARKPIDRRTTTLETNAMKETNTMKEYK